MRGSVRKRGTRWEYRLELGEQPAQLCRECGKLYWLEGRARAKCECDGQLDNVDRRRERTKSGFRTKTIAQDALDTVKGQLKNGEYVEPTKTTVAGYLVNEWLPAVKGSLRPSTYSSYRLHVECYLVPRIGTIRLRHLKASDIDACYQELLEDGRRRRPKVKDADGQEVPDVPTKLGLSPMTVHHTHTVLHKALALAVKRKYIATNPDDASEPPKVKGADKHEMKTWSGDQVRAFLEATEGDRLNPLWRLIVSLGLRRGEALGLMWKDVDLRPQTLRLGEDEMAVEMVVPGTLAVRRTLVSADYVVKVSEPKTRKSTRVLPLAAGTVTALKDQAARQADESQQWGDAWQDTGYVFTNEDGRPMHPDLVTKRFKETVQAAPVPLIRLHDLRHSFATMALRAGVPLKVVSEMLGHSNINITADTYQHVNREMLSDATARVEARFTSAPAVVSGSESE